MAQVWPAQPPRIAVGTATIPRATWTPIAFPPGLFTQPPKVVVQGNGSDAAPSHYNVTTAGFEAWIAGVGTTAPVDWIAIQL